jgi:PAS domain S-box-containing protein
MTQALRVLIVEDADDDVALLLRALRRGGYTVAYEVVETPAAMRAALECQDWDVITSDNTMLFFSGLAALALARELRPDVPFIVVSGELDLNLAVSLIKRGAQDYIPKDELGRLVPVIERALREAVGRRERQSREDALKASETRYRRLFETAQDGILILEADTGRIIDVNPFLAAMLGYAQEDLLGKALWEIGAFKDIEATKLAFAALQSQGYIRYEDLPLETHDGRLIAVEFVSNLYVVDHQQVIQCNIRDITARTQAEAEIRTRNADLERRVRDLTVQLEALS